MNQDRQNTCILTGSLWVGLAMGIGGLLLDPKGAVPGLIRIMSHQDLLITDYIELAGIGSALLNVSLMLLATVGLLLLSGDKCHGFTLAELGLMAGFAFFGKNLANSWPIVLGTWIFSRIHREPFHRYIAVALLTTSLAPLVSWLMFGSRYASIPLGAAVGILLGYVMPDLSAYTYKVLNGVSLYNAGFACGLLATLAVSILAAVGDRPDTVLIWSSRYSVQIGAALALCSAALIGAAFLTGEPARSVWDGWLRMLGCPGRSPCDWLRDFGLGTVLLNTGVNGILGIGYILVIGGQFSGPVVGGILTLMGFAGGGKHIRNCLPVMAGVAVGCLLMRTSPAVESLQIAGLFGTTLAPMSGTFGIFAGVLAGALHSAVVRQTGGPVAGMNLYNNGFSGGLVAMVLYPLLTAIHHRRPNLRLQNIDYIDTLEGEVPSDDDEGLPDGDGPLPGSPAPPEEDGEAGAVESSQN